MLFVFIAFAFVFVLLYGGLGGDILNSIYEIFWPDDHSRGGNDQE